MTNPEKPVKLYARCKASMILFYTTIMVYIYLGCFGLYAAYKSIPYKYANGEIVQVFFAIIIGILGGIFLLRSGIHLILSRWGCTYAIELYEDRIIGYPMAGYNYWELKWNEIDTFSLPRFGGWHCSLVDIHGTELRISYYTAPFVECIEDILSRIPELKHSDLKRLKRNTVMWNRKRKMVVQSDKEIQQFIDKAKRNIERAKKRKKR